MIVALAEGLRSAEKQGIAPLGSWGGFGGGDSKSWN
jgi:hypothetical protein